MATKMKITEITKSLQAQGNDIKGSDLVKLLNENGFDVKSTRSNIEDAAIAFLLKKFSQPAKTNTSGNDNAKKDAAPAKEPVKDKEDDHRELIDSFIDKL